MTTITGRVQVTDDRILRFKLACDVPPEPVDVTVTIRPIADQPGSRPTWDALSGVGREVWQGADAAQYVRDLREDRDRKL